MEETNEQEGKRQLTLKFLAGFILGFLIVALFFFFLLPVHSRSKELARRAICAANLNEIGKGIVIYHSSSCYDLNPPDLATLVQEGHVVLPDNLVCPSSGTERATTTQPADVEAHCDYIYVTGLRHVSSSIVLAFELPANHGQEVVNVLYVDFHVECMGDMNKFAGELQHLNEYIAEEREAKR